MVTEDLYSKWSTLPPDLVRRIADSFLHTNDVDCYMDMRAVCPSWRAATDDPKDNASDRRYQLRRWVVLDESFQSEGKTMLLLNADTGRFRHRKLPLPSDHNVVATTHGGYFVLAHKRPPHAASVLNPLTGVVVRFAAPVPAKVGGAGVVFGGSSLLKLVLICSSSRTHYTAGPDSRCFTVHESTADYDLLLKAAVGGGVYAHVAGPAVGPVLFKFVKTYGFDPDKFFSGCANGDRGFLVGMAEHMLLVFKPRRATSPCVSKFDMETRGLWLMQSIGRFAIFVGHRRCLAVNADKFPGVEANCVYYTEHLGSSAHICRCHNGRVEMISEAVDFVKQGEEFVLVAERPFTITHLLSSYTINTPVSPLALQQMSQGAGLPR